MDEKIVPTHRISDEFTKHLAIEGNEKIIFSGRFGIGKTTFLNGYFKDNDKYVNVRLSPVHYSISSNEDIFEFIKFDIIFQLLAQNFIQKDSKLSNGKLAIDFVGENLYPSLAKFIKFIPGIGKDLSEILDTIKEIYKDFKQYKENVNKDRYTEALTFLKKIEAQTGNPYERNQITELINTILSFIKETYGKKVVLIIDDFDRIDPEHIFRVLNVFASQCDDEFNCGKKYIFDHIIIVCDIDNIRNIFHHKYGVGTDFVGYIDKFYSKQIFRFDIKPEFRNICRRFIEPALKYSKIYNNRYVFEGCNVILEELINNGDINFRLAHNIDGLTIPLYSYSYENTTLEPANPGYLILNFLSSLLGEYQLDTLINKYDSINRMYSFDSKYRFTAGAMIDLCLYDWEYRSQKNDKMEITIQNYRYILDHNSNVLFYRYDTVIKEITYAQSTEKVNVFPFWQIVQHANEVRKFFISNGELRQY